ncbi:hypothetical protein ACNS7O_02365 [Haloferacaceae archaeon DSL9]
MDLSMVVAVVAGLGLRESVYFLVIYGITFAVAVWVYRDARRRGTRGAILWAIGTFLLTVFVLFPYLYLRLKEEGSIA